MRVAEKQADGQWKVNQWLKKAVLLSFRLNDMSVIKGGPGKRGLVGQGALEIRRLERREFEKAGFRAVPGSIVRRSAYIAPGVMLMPSFVNLGAYVDDGTMVDTWATVGSCAQIGKNCHLSGGVGIGGVLEPLQAGPIIIEDNCFIGARSEVVEGVIVREGSVLGMGVFIGASTTIIDRETGEIMLRRSAALFGGRLRHHGRQADQHRRARTEPLLRRDRQARRREDALQDQHQRIAAGLRGKAMAMNDSQDQTPHVNPLGFLFELQGTHRPQQISRRPRCDCRPAASACWQRRRISWTRVAASACSFR